MIDWEEIPLWGDLHWSHLLMAENEPAAVVVSLILELERDT